MRWSVGIEAEGDRVLTREQVVELADAVAASGGIATGIGTNRYGAQLIVEAGSREEAIAKATAGVHAGRSRGRAPGRPGGADRGDQRGRGRLLMIRLGSLAGYPFEGPRAAGGLDAAGRPRPSTRSPISRNLTPSRTGTRSSTWATPTTCPRSGSRSSTRARTAGSSGPDPSGRSTSAPTRCRAAAGRTGSRSPGN